MRVQLDALRQSCRLIITLQGLGDAPEGFLRLARQLRSKPGLNHVQFILPAA
jgi:hypothetical protein